jgi:uncharacterized protein YcbK (DUF882 family)
MQTRRSVLTAGLGFAMAGPAFAARAEARTLRFDNLHTAETLSVTYWETGAYLPDALAAIDKVLRDFRTGDIHPIAPGLLDLLVSLNAHTGTRAAYQVISGYRSPKTNAALAHESGGVSPRSLHMEGKAIDIRLADVALPRLRDAALSLGAGGVGFYPSSDFVHVDIGRVRHWG